ncbi:carcinoembryonic antigen-related cell adhesion molecule, partial [Pristimantis euphronides]
MWIWMISVFPCLWLDMVYGTTSIQLIPQNPFISESVTLKVNGINEKIENFTWYKGSKPDSLQQILKCRNWPSLVLFPGPQYDTRISPFGNGSLQINDIQSSDEGNYTVMIYTQEIKVILTVYGEKPEITSSHCPAQEDDLYALTCVTANAKTISWSRQNNSFPYGAITSADARILTFTNLKRSDAGGYRCEAKNLVSKKISDVFTLTVLYNSKDTIGLSIAVIAGIVCGTLLVIAIIIAVTYLLYKRYMLPLKMALQATQDHPEIYENALDVASVS